MTKLLNKTFAPLLLSFSLNFGSDFENVNALEYFGSDLDYASCLDSNYFAISSIDIEGDESIIIPIGQKWTIDAQNRFIDSVGCLIKKDPTKTYKTLLAMDGINATKAILDFHVNTFPKLSDEDRIKVATISASKPNIGFVGFYRVLAIDTMPELRIEGARGLIGTCNRKEIGLTSWTTDSSIVNNHPDSRFNGFPVAHAIRILIKEHEEDAKKNTRDAS